MPEVSESDFCRALTQRLGTDHALVVAELANAGNLRRTTSIPSAALAAKRFEAAVLSASTAWREAGRLDWTHVGLLFEAQPINLEPSLRESAARYGFDDPYSGAGRIDLSVVAVTILLKPFANLVDVMREAAMGLTQASAEVPPDWRAPLHPDRWCGVREA